MRTLIQAFRRVVDKFAYESMQSMVDNKDIHDRLSVKVAAIKEDQFTGINYYRHPDWMVFAFSENIEACTQVLAMASVRVLAEKKMYGVTDECVSGYVPAHRFLMREQGADAQELMMAYKKAVIKLSDAAKPYQHVGDDHLDSFNQKEIHLDALDLLDKAESCVDSILDLQLRIKHQHN